jgi:hypothetical protein
MVDMVRIAAYAATFFLTRAANPIGPGHYPLVLAGVLLLGIALALGAGII